MSQFDYILEGNELRIVDHYAGRETTLWFTYRYYDIFAEQLRDYLLTLFDHIIYVREAGKLLGVSEQQLRSHDTSKLGLEELPYYVRQFKGDKADPDGFAKAWLHHIHWNEHHWQHWVFPDNPHYHIKGSSMEDGTLPMPMEYVREMVADWMGANRTYQGSWDMTEWLEKNMPKLRVHSETAANLRSMLDHLGYADVAYVQKFQGEGDE